MERYGGRTRQSGQPAKRSTNLSVASNGKNPTEKLAINVDQLHNDGNQGTHTKTLDIMGLAQPRSEHEKKKLPT